jgi:hypothetical protein
VLAPEGELNAGPAGVPAPGVEAVALLSVPAAMPGGVTTAGPIKPDGGPPKPPPTCDPPIPPRNAGGPKPLAAPSGPPNPNWPPGFWPSVSPVKAGTTTAEAKNEAKHNLAVDLNLFPFDTVPLLAKIASLQNAEYSLFYMATHAVNAPRAAAMPPRGTPAAAYLQTALTAHGC